MSESAQPARCPGCGAETPGGSRFCPHCGTRLEPAGPRWFGVPPATVLLALSAAALVAGIILVATGSWLAGLILVGVALLFLAGFLEAASRKPDAEIARTSADRIGGLRARAGVAAKSVAARSGARREILRRRNELAALEATRNALLKELGAAVYQGDSARVDEFQSRLRTLDESALRTQNEIAEIAQATESEVRRARLEVQQTEVVAPEPRPPGSDPQ